MKMTLRSAALAAALVAPLAFAQAPASAGTTTWEADPAHSSTGFAVKHMGLSTVRGTFGKTEATIVLDPSDVTKSTVTATIDAKTINTQNGKRDEHLKSGDFFDTGKHPNLTFKSTKVERAGEGKLKVTGDLTMKGVTKPVVLDVTGPSKPVSVMGGERTAVAATTRLSRKEWGLTWNKALETGGVMVSDEVDVNLDLQLVKKAPGAEESKKETVKAQETKAGEKPNPVPAGKKKQ